MFSLIVKGRRQKAKGMEWCSDERTSVAGYGTREEGAMYAAVCASEVAKSLRDDAHAAAVCRPSHWDPERYIGHEYEPSVVGKKKPGVY